MYICLFVCLYQSLLLLYMLKPYLRRTVHSDRQSASPNFTEGHPVNTVAQDSDTAINADPVIPDLDGEWASGNVNAI